jgi:hypothetical protein
VRWAETAREHDWGAARLAVTVCPTTGSSGRGAGMCGRFVLSGGSPGREEAPREMRH